MLESVCGDVDGPKSVVMKDMRVTYAKLCQGYMGKKLEKVRRRTSDEWEGGEAYQDPYPSVTPDSKSG